MAQRSAAAMGVVAAAATAVRRTLIIGAALVVVTAPGWTAEAPGADGRPVTPPWGFDLSGMDPAVHPGDSMFDYANGAWVARTEIPPDKVRWGAFDVLRDRTLEQLRAIVTEAAGSGAAPDTDTGRIGALYTAFMDEERLERLDLTPLTADLERIRDATTREAIVVRMGRTRGDFGTSLFNLGVGADDKDPDRNVLQASQGGLGLPDRDYYLQDTFKDAKAAYRDYVARLLGMAGWPEADGRADDIVAFETRIAEASWSRAESRDRIKTYHRMTTPELQAVAPEFPWRVYLNAAGVPDPGAIVVGQDTAFPKLATIFAATPLATLRAWQAFHVVDQAAPFLSSRFVTARFEFRNRKLAGQLEPEPRWRRGLQFVNGAVGEAVGREYVARHFPPASKARMEELVDRLKRALRARIERVSWMTPTTRDRALEKLALLGVKIGYPVKWKDYSALRIDPADLVGDVRRADAFDWATDVAKLDKPVDRQEWQMPPQTVNAYYEPTLNEIVFPAAILQPPFFDPGADMAVNYGGIGGVIGHEMTHGFDDQGRKSDGHGVLADWWQPEDAARFQAQADRLGAQYNGFAVAPGLYVNGALTMGENIADLGGILLAVDAYRDSLKGAPAPVIDGFTGDQRVFLGWAQVWRAKTRPDALKQQVTVDPHSPPQFRVDGPVRNVDAWYDAFGVKPGDRLYLPPEERVRIW